MQFFVQCETVNTVNKRLGIINNTALSHTGKFLHNGDTETHLVA